jgi:hypothetical protein
MHLEGNVFCKKESLKLRSDQVSFELLSLQYTRNVTIVQLGGDKHKWKI